MAQVFIVGKIGDVAVQLSVIKGFQHRTVFHDFPPGKINEGGSRLHLVYEFMVHQATGLFIQGHVYRNNIRLLQHCPKIPGELDIVG